MVAVVAVVERLRAWAGKRWALRLASGSVPLGLVLGPMSTAAWNLGAEPPTRPGPQWLAVWLAQNVLTWIGDSAPPSTMWGALHAVSVVPVALTMLAVRERLFVTWGRAGMRVVLTAFLLGSVAMLSGYTIGFGFPLDLLAFLVAAIASVALGIRILARRKAPPAVGWMCSVGLVAALGASLWWCGPYVPAFVVLALTIGWGAVGVLTARRGDDAPSGTRAAADVKPAGLA